MEKKDNGHSFIFDKRCWREYGGKLESPKLGPPCGGKIRCEEVRFGNFTEKVGKNNFHRRSSHLEGGQGWALGSKKEGPVSSGPAGLTEARGKGCLAGPGRGEQQPSYYGLELGTHKSYSSGSDLETGPGRSNPILRKESRRERDRRSFRTRRMRGGGPTDL